MPLYFTEKFHNNGSIFLFQQMEFEWVLHEEVHAVLNQLHTILLVTYYLLFGIII
jgi:hypothetical protein